MDNIRIAILSTNNTPVAFMDNAHKKSMHYWDDELHEYLQGTANTYTFTVSAKHQDAENVTAGNKVAFIHKGKSPVSYTHLDVYKRQSVHQELRRQKLQPLLFWQKAIN